MKIVIVGAGLGGLAAATCFAKAGHDVVVYERRDRLSPQGAIIGLRPSAFRILSNNGLQGQLDDANHALGESQFQMLGNGQLVKNIDLHDEQAAGEGLTRLTTRPELSKMLFETAIQAGATIRFGMTVSDLDEDSASAHLKFADGSSCTADFVLVADGIRSRLRAKVLNDHDAAQREPVITDTTFYVFHIPAAGLPGDVKQRIFDSKGPWVRMTGWVGKDAWAMSAFDKEKDIVNLGLAIVEPTSQASLWDEDGDVQYVRDFFQTRACGDILELLNVAKQCDRWRLAYMPSLPRWTSAGHDGQGGRIALGGDSVHAILPNGGAGLSLTIDDIGALSHLFSRHDGKTSDGKSDVPRLLKVWQHACKPRAERLREFGLFNMRCLQGDAEALAERERGWRDETANGPNAVPDMHAPFSTMSFSRYLSGYDPIAAVDALLDSKEQSRP